MSSRVGRGDQGAAGVAVTGLASYPGPDGGRKVSGRAAVVAVLTTLAEASSGITCVRYGEENTVRHGNFGR